MTNMERAVELFTLLLDADEKTEQYGGKRLAPELREAVQRLVARPEILASYLTIVQMYLAVMSKEVIAMFFKETLETQAKLPPLPSEAIEGAMLKIPLVSE
jgi:hypothetical protein